MIRKEDIKRIVNNNRLPYSWSIVEGGEQVDFNVEYTTQEEHEELNAIMEVNGYSLVTEDILDEFEDGEYSSIHTYTKN
jgi:hypothetical protein